MYLIRLAPFVRVTVLEAENRPGGRLFTKKVEVKDKNGDAGENREQYHVIQKSHFSYL